MYARKESNVATEPHPRHGREDGGPAEVAGESTRGCGNLSCSCSLTAGRKGLSVPRSQAHTPLYSWEAMRIAKGVSEALRSPVKRGMLEYFAEHVWQVKTRHNSQFNFRSAVEPLGARSLLLVLLYCIRCAPCCVL